MIAMEVIARVSTIVSTIIAIVAFVRKLIDERKMSRLLKTDGSWMVGVCSPGLKRRYQSCGNRLGFHFVILTLLIFSSQ